MVENLVYVPSTLLWITMMYGIFSILDTDSFTLFRASLDPHKKVSAATNINLVYTSLGLCRVPLF